MDEISQKITTGLIVSVISLIITQLILLYKENLKQNRTYLQEVYMPLFNDLIKCHYTLITPRAEHDLKETISATDMMSKIQKHFTNKISSCDLYVLKFIIRNTHETMLDNFKGETVFIDDFIWITFYIESFRRMLKKAHIYDMNINKSLLNLQQFFAFMYQTIALYEDREMAYCIAQQYWNIDIEKINYQKVYKKKMIKNEFINYIIDSYCLDSQDNIRSLLARYYE